MNLFFVALFPALAIAFGIPLFDSFDEIQHRWNPTIGRHGVPWQLVVRPHCDLVRHRL